MCEVESLIDRPIVSFDFQSFDSQFADRRVLITGAGGSIGAELARRVLRCEPRHLYLLDRDAHALAAVMGELSSSATNSVVTPFVVDIADAPSIEAIFRASPPQIVFHAAAEKHLPAVEASPGRAVRTNVLGTQVIADASRRFEAEAFVYTSSDKAVDPVSVMGATKRAAEIYILSLASEKSATRFSIVRFGNVLGSSGSVVPAFASQIAAGGPVIVTHPAMRRYFMTLEESTGLAMLAAAHAANGEIYLLQMGTPLRIADLAKRMIHRAESATAIAFTAPRPGEKIEEALAYSFERPATAPHRGILCYHAPARSRQNSRTMIDALEKVVGGDPQAIIAELIRWLPEYQPGRLAHEVVTAQFA